MITAAQITLHAWKRFKSRWKGEPPADYKKELCELLAKAQEEDLGHAAAVRIITNGFKPARYFRSGEWRFVLSEDLSAVLTIELAYHNKWKRPAPRGKKAKRKHARAKTMQGQKV